MGVQIGIEVYIVNQHVREKEIVKTTYSRTICKRLKSSTMQLVGSRMAPSLHNF